MLERATLREVFAACAEPGSGEEAWRAALAKGERATPWFVRVLVGLGGWVSAILLGAAVAATDVGSSSAGMLTIGAIAALGATALRYRARSDFLAQLALAASLGGRALVYFGVGKNSSDEGVLGLAIVLELLTAAFYPDVVGRFLATVGACGAAIALPHALHDHGAADRTAIETQLVVAVVGLAALIAWAREPALVATRVGAAAHRPIAFGLVTGLFVGLFAVMEPWDDHRRDHALSHLLAASLALLLAEVARQVTWALGATPSTKAIAYAAVLAFGLLALRAPGLLAGALVLALAVHRRNTALFAMAVVFLVAFGSWFYYDLELSLLAKSGVLAASGAVLLGSRQLLRWRVPA